MMNWSIKVIIVSSSEAFRRSMLSMMRIGGDSESAAKMADKMSAVLVRGPTLELGQITAANSSSMVLNGTGDAMKIELGSVSARVLRMWVLPIPAGPVKRMDWFLWINSAASLRRSSRPMILV